MSHIYIILNPVSGTEDAERLQRTIAHHFAAQPGAYEIYRTTGQERLADVVQEAQRRGFETFVAAGGDGTVSAVADGLVNTHLPLGILPTGTGNVLARELGIPLNPKDALELVTGAHQTHAIDVLRAGARHCLLSVSLGLSSLTMQDTGREEKRVFGLLAYLWTGVKKLVGFQPVGFELTLDGDTFYRRAAEVTVANDGVLGMPAFRWGPDVALDDGRLDICFIHARNLLAYLKIGRHAVWGKQRHEPRLHCLEGGKRATVRADRDLPVQADGEIIGRQSIEVEILPRALDVIVPATRSSASDGNREPVPRT